MKIYRAVAAKQCSDKEAVKLINGTTTNEGRVVICVNGEWSTAYSYSWGLLEARVTCREQGFHGMCSIMLCKYLVPLLH